jgi:hypothetical protein
MLESRAPEDGWKLRLRVMQVRGLCKKIVADRQPGPRQLPAFIALRIIRGRHSESSWIKVVPGRASASSTLYRAGDLSQLETDYAAIEK